MKLFWFIILYLTVNEVQSFGSKLQNQKEIDAQALLESMNEILLRLAAVEKSCEEYNKIQLRLDSIEESFQEHLEKDTSIDTTLEQLTKFHNITPVIAQSSVQKVDCSEKCDEDVSCTSVFWSNSSDSECRFIKDKSILVEFTPGEIYYCKDCETTIDFVIEAEYSGVIKLFNLALNKTTEASSYTNEKTNSPKVADGDLNTWFSSEALLTKGEPWLMVDLGQRYMVAIMRIHIRPKPIYKGRGGYFQVCLVDNFNRNVNPCNKETEVLKLNRRLRSYNEQVDLKRIIMGRYLVLKKLREEILEIVELEVQVVIPVASYYCDKCNARVNTVCDDSKIPPECRCFNKFLPINGDAINGCKDPFIETNVGPENIICTISSIGTVVCTCKPNHFVAAAGNEDGTGKPGCINPCITNPCNSMNTYCLPVSAKNRFCGCSGSNTTAIKGDATTNGCQKKCVAPFKELDSESGSPCYLLVSTPLMFPAAKTSCEGMSAMLAEPTATVASVTELTKKLEALFIAEISAIKAVTTSYGRDIYIGMIEDSPTGPFRSLIGPGSAPSTAPLFSSLSNSKTEAAAIVIDEGSLKYTLRARDDPNTSRVLPYLCQKARPT